MVRVTPAEMTEVRLARQTRGMGGQIGQGDRLAVMARHRDAGWHPFLQRIVERHHAALDHAGQEERGKGLGHRTDLEDGLCIRCLLGETGDFAEADGLAVLARDHADHHSDGPFGRGEVGNNLFDLGLLATRVAR